MAEAVDEKRGRIDGKVTVSRCMEFRINPTMEQKTLIWKTFGYCRFVWNNLLQERIEYEEKNKGRLLNTTPAHLKKNNMRGRFPLSFKHPAGPEPVIQASLRKRQEA